MEAIYFGSAGRRATGPFKEDGPWIGADLENGLCVARPVARPVAAPLRAQLRAQLRPCCGPVAAPLLPPNALISLLRCRPARSFAPGSSGRCAVQSRLFGLIKRADTSL